MPVRVLILNGANLNMLGIREPELYGKTTLAEVEVNCRAAAKAAGLAMEFRQTNHEGQLIDWVQEARGKADAIVINPAGSSFHSVALLDALKTFEGPVIELHVTNIHARDRAHRHSIISQGVKGVICGLGADGYVVAIQAVARMFAKPAPG